MPHSAHNRQYVRSRFGLSSAHMCRYGRLLIGIVQQYRQLLSFYDPASSIAARMTSTTCLPVGSSGRMSHSLFTKS
jgi:hypothetical protein